MPRLTELHDALAEHFIASQFDAKALFRVIVGSRVYQQAERKVPDRKVPFTGAVPKKLRGDEVFDSLATAIGLPNKEGEPEKATSDTRFPPPPKSTRDLVNEAFGYDPSFQDSLINRTMKQAMLMMNNDQILKQIEADAEQRDDARQTAQIGTGQWHRAGCALCPRPRPPAHRPRTGDYRETSQSPSATASKPSRTSSGAWSTARNSPPGIRLN